jgi:hypothetical protein
LRLASSHEYFASDTDTTKVKVQFHPSPKQREFADTTLGLVDEVLGVEPGEEKLLGTADPEPPAHVTDGTFLSGSHRRIENDEMEDVIEVTQNSNCRESEQGSILACEDDSRREYEEVETDYAPNTEPQCCGKSLHAVHVYR